MADCSWKQLYFCLFSGLKGPEERKKQTNLLSAHAVELTEGEGQTRVKACTLEADTDSKQLICISRKTILRKAAKHVTESTAQLFAPYQWLSVASTFYVVLLFSRL